MAPEAGFEPATIALTGHCSTVELLRITSINIITAYLLDQAARGRWVLLSSWYKN